MLVADDFNKDSYIDIVVPGYTHLGSGDGTFLPVAGGGPWPQFTLGIAAADLNSDGYLDVAVSVREPPSVQLFRGDGAGAFIQFGTVDLPYPPRELILADFNSDRMTDLAAAVGTTSGSVAVCLGTETGFSPPVYYHQSHHWRGSDTLTLLYNTFQHRGSALAGVQKTRISSPGDWFQELVFNYNTLETLVHPPQSGAVDVSAPAPYGQWNGTYHYDYMAGAFTQARYGTRQILVSTGEADVTPSSRSHR